MKSKIILLSVVVINLLTLSLIFSGAAYSATNLTCASIDSGDWSEPTIWDCEESPGLDDDATVNDDVDIYEEEHVHNLTISGIPGMDGYLWSYNNLSIGGNFIVEGDFVPGEYTVTLNGQSGVQLVETIDNAFLNFNSLVIDNDGEQGVVVLGNLVTILSKTIVMTGSLLDIGNNYLEFEDATSFTNHGSVRQTLNMDGSGGAQALDFLQINQLPSNDFQFYGVTITTTENLNNVTVTLTSNADQCTTNPSAVHVNRCFTIESETEPTNDVRVRFYARNSELNGVTLAELVPFRFVDGSGWQQLTDVITGTKGADYVYAEGTTTGFSSFLLGSRPNAPTAITLRNFSARNEIRSPIFAAVLTVIFAFALTGLLWRRQRT